MKEITIIVPCYNVAEYIDRCLASIVNQTIGTDKLSIICVNDASTDNTWDKLLEWEKKYPEDILLINCEENGRQGTARNIGLNYVQTKYVAYVDSDDWIEPDMYEKLHRVMVQYDCDIVFCRNFRSSEYTLAEKSGKEKRCKNKDMLLYINSDEERKKFIVNNTIGYGCWDKLIKTELLLENNISFPEKMAYEDIYWGSQLYLYARKVYVLEERLYHYFVNLQSTVLGKNRLYHKDIFKVNELKWQMYEESGFMDKYRAELEFDYLVTGYLGGLKVLALRYTEDTYEYFTELCSMVREKIAAPYNNPYNNCLSEFNQLQLKLLGTRVSKEEWEMVCRLYREKAGV